MNYEKLLDEAKEHLQEIEIGKEFYVKELVGTEWVNLKKGDKLGFGRHFKREVTDGNVQGVIYVNKAPNNSAVYRRINVERMNN